MLKVEMNFGFSAADLLNMVRELIATNGGSYGRFHEAFVIERDGI